MEPRINLVTLGVADVDRAVEFYRELGFPVDRRGDAAFFELDGAWLSVFPREALAADAGVDAGQTRFDGVTLAHNVGSREEVDRVLAELAAAGGEVTQPGRETDWGGYSGSVADGDDSPGGLVAQSVRRVRTVTEPVPVALPAVPVGPTHATADHFGHGPVRFGLRTVGLLHLSGFFERLEYDCLHCVSCFG